MAVIRGVFKGRLGEGGLLFFRAPPPLIFLGPPLWKIFTLNVKLVNTTVKFDLSAGSYAILFFHFSGNRIYEIGMTLNPRCSFPQIS